MRGVLLSLMAAGLVLSAAACDGPSKEPRTSAASASIIRINFGRAEPYKDSAGHTWLGDAGMADGDIVDRGAGMAIKNTRDPDLYRTEHWGMTAFTWPVPNGKYLLKMHFAETSENVSGIGGRVFTITVEGKELKDFDPWAKAGGFATAYVESVPVTITDGKLDITFDVHAEQTEINAIEIIPQ